MILKYEHDILCSKIENFQFFFLKKILGDFKNC